MDKITVWYFFFHRMLNDFLKTVVFEVGILLICLLGDHLLSSPVTKQTLIRAMADSLTHGLVGGISWAVVTNVQLDRQRVLEWIVCMGLAMSVDVDHFVAAKSLQLKVLKVYYSLYEFSWTRMLAFCLTW